MMLSEIKGYFHFINTDETGKKNRNLIIIAVLTLLVLFFLNYFFFFQFTSDDLLVRFQQANLLFLNNLSPYDDDVQSFIENGAKDASWETNEHVFDIEIALPHLIFYLPFSLFTDYHWGVSLFLTLTELSILLSAYLLFQLLQVEFSSYNIYLLLLLSITGLYLLKTVFSGSSIPISLLMLVACLEFLHSQKKISTGILLGLLIFDVANIPILVVILVFGLIRTNQFISVFWAAITSSITVLFVMVFDRDWLIGWLKNLFLSPQRVPFLTYPQALSLKYGVPTIQFFSFLSLILMTWLVFEAWRNPYNSTAAWLWVLGLGAIINFYLIIQIENISSVTLLITQTVITSLWLERISEQRHIIITIITAVMTLSVSIGFFLLPAGKQNQFFNGYMVLFSIFSVLNLYWLRRWAVNPFAYDENFLNF